MLVNCLWEGVVRITDSPDMTSDVHCGCKATNKTNKQFETFEKDTITHFLISKTFVFSRCFICQSEVQEDESAIQKKDARTLLARFNEQIQPIYELLQECEDVKLAPELLEPEPTDIKKAR